MWRGHHGGERSSDDSDAQRKRSPIHVRRSKSLLCNRAGSWQFSDRERCNIILDNAALPVQVPCQHYGGLSSRNRPPRTWHLSPLGAALRQTRPAAQGSHDASRPASSSSAIFYGKEDSSIHCQPRCVIQNKNIVASAMAETNPRPRAALRIAK